MKTLTEILGGAQMFLGLEYDPQICFEEYLSQDQRAFLELLRLIEAHLFISETHSSRIGRPSFLMFPFVRAFLAKSFFNATTTDNLRKRLKTDSNLRQICGFKKVPSPATFSRRMKELAETTVLETGLDDLVKKYLSGTLVGHISRDSTAISAREKPENKKRDVAIPVKVKAKRGRPCKGESRPEKEPSRLERQIGMESREAIAELDMLCTWGCKKNSQGNISYWKGYKLHLDVTDLGIPVTVIVTGANVHDSQVAIPMEKLTERKVTHLYSVMDSAYDATPIFQYIDGKGRIALIDPNKRRNEAKRSFDPAQKERFKIRTTVERANAHLKDWLLPPQVFVRGIKKVSFQLNCGVLCLAALKILQYFIYDFPVIAA